MSRQRALLLACVACALAAQCKATFNATQDGLPYDDNNQQLPTYIHAEYSPSECQKLCEDNIRAWESIPGRGCVAASYKAAGPQYENWCALWAPWHCESTKPRAVRDYVTEAGATTNIPTKVVQPSTLPANATVWAGSGDGWVTWLVTGKRNG